MGRRSPELAPVRIGAGATVGAGSTITEDAPDGKLTLTRARQTTVKDWKRPAKPAAEAAKGEILPGPDS
jgi:bifunctional UDP-N-acetylglucosamine pyrophosphorylase/glucosamine-1-phosphate N-acetyltransferase